MISRRSIVGGLCRAMPFALLRRGMFAQTANPVLREQSFAVPLVGPNGQVNESYNASSLTFTENLGEGVTLQLAAIPGGMFQMGSDIPQRSIGVSAQPIHPVSLRPFFLGTYPVTRSEWRRVASMPKVAVDLGSVFPNQLPVDVVPFRQAEEFCARLVRYSGRPYRLPSESEWEYACRAGTSTRYHFGDSISLAVANYNDGIQRPVSLTPVGSKQVPNRFGLHDMHGNVIEWCSDLVHPTYSGAPADGSAWLSGADPNSRVLRGGSYAFGADSARSDSRYGGDQRGTFSGLGFRVALDAPGDFYDPVFSREGLVDAAQLSAGSICSGSIVSIFGTAIGATAPAKTPLNAAGVGTDLGGVQVFFNGRPAPLLHVSRNQINAVVPLGLAEPTIEVIVKNQGQTSTPVKVPRSEAAPAVFTSDGSGFGQGAILNQDYSVNSSISPARRGSVVSLFATGTGPTNPPGKDGEIVLAPAPAVLQVRARIADTDAPVEYAGSAPGLVYGVTQVNVRIPENASRGQVAVVLFVGDAQSPAGVTVAIS